jgi:ubiquinone/menaquinone biosynthesis C-methylase UbiE
MSSQLHTEINTDRIQDALYAFTRSQILFTAIELDLFTAIRQGKNDLPTLTQSLNLNERGLRLLLNGLIGIGFLQVSQDNRYVLPPDVAEFLVKDADNYLGGMVHHCKRLYENWSLLTEAVDAGQPVGGAQSLAQLETYFSELAKGLYVSNYPTAKKLAERLGLDKATRDHLHVLDVAGGSAVWSIAMLEKNAHSRATVIDFPSVMHVAQAYVTQHGLEERFSYLPGDLEDMELPAAQFDLAILANICHTLGPVATEKTIQKLAAAMKPGGRLAIVDFVPDDRRSQPGWPLIFGVNMLITTPEGDVFTAAEYKHWLQQAGFSRISFQEIDKEVTAIIAEIE